MRRLLIIFTGLLIAQGALAQSIEVDAGAADDAARPALTLSRETSVSRETQKPEKPASIASRPLRILLVYTPRALTDVPDIHTGAALVISQINMTLANSNIALTAELAGMDRVDYAEAASETSATMLDAVTNGVGDFARIRSLRTVTQADVVMVLAHWTYDGYCGRAWQLDTLDSGVALAAAARYGYSVVSTDGGNCAFAITAPHEIGHNLGGAHDRYVVPNAIPGPAGYNYGYVDVAARVRDMMAYANECTAQGLRCVRLFIYADPDILHNGRPFGVPVSDLKAAAAAKRIREIAPYLVQFRDALRGLPNMLAVVTRGQGAVTGPAIDCGPTCSAEYVENAAITLTPRPAPGWRFAGWSGACDGLAPCAVTMGGPRAVTARFIPSLHLGGVSAASTLRVANTGTTPGRVAVDIANAATGAWLGRWTSTAIAPNAARAVTTADLETAIVPGTALPAAYAVTVEPESADPDSNFTVQHISTQSGALANLSTCDGGVTAPPLHVTAQSSTAGPGTVVVAQTVRGNATLNAGNHDSAPVTLTLFDAADGTRLGAYTTPAIPRGGQLMVAVADMEHAAGLTPRADRAYTVTADDSFSGALQYLVTRGGVAADLTTACAFQAPAPVFDTNAMIQPGPVVSGQSFLRFFNTGAGAGTVNVTLADIATGAPLGQWTSPPIAPGAARQFALAEIEAAVSAPRPSSSPRVYTALVQTQIAGTLQHVLWRADGALVNASSCDVGVGATPAQVANVHAGALAGYPSSLVLTNTGAAAAGATIGLYDAATGQKRGVYTTAPVPAGGQLTLSMAAIQPTAPDVPHYVVKIENGFPGFLQHLVANTAAGVVTDLTAACALPAPSVRYALCDPTQPCALPADGTGTIGQLKSQYLTDTYRVTLAGPVTIEIKGRDSNSGTLYAPRLMVYGADAGAPLLTANGGGVGRDVRVVFTPQAPGTYTLAVSARDVGYSNEDDFQVVTPTTGTYRISVTP